MGEAEGVVGRGGAPWGRSLGADGHVDPPRPRLNALHRTPIERVTARGVSARWGWGQRAVGGELAALAAVLLLLRAVGVVARAAAGIAQRTASDRYRGLGREHGGSEEAAAATAGVGDAIERGVM